MSYGEPPGPVTPWVLTVIVNILSSFENLSQELKTKTSVNRGIDYFQQYCPALGRRDVVRRRTRSGGRRRHQYGLARSCHVLLAIWSVDHGRPPLSRATFFVQPPATRV